MNEPALDLSEIVGLYKDDARRSVQQMREALQRWEDVASGGAACKTLRKMSHQLRGSGRTYGFRNVSRISKAVEHLIQKIESRRIAPDARLRQALSGHIEQLAVIFQA